MVRLPDGMREKLKVAAKVGRRTMNAEIVARLEFAFAVDAVVQESGWDVTHGMGSPEWITAMLKRLGSGGDQPGTKTLEQRVQELEERMGAVESRQRSKG